MSRLAVANVSFRDCLPRPLTPRHSSFAPDRPLSRRAVGGDKAATAAAGTPFFSLRQRWCASARFAIWSHPTVIGNPGSSKISKTDLGRIEILWLNGESGSMRERFGARGGRRLGQGESKVEDPPKA